MTQQQRRSPSSTRQVSLAMRFANSYYAELGLYPSASVIEVRRAYRQLSKRYHPDTTDLPPAEATVKFQQLNEAYATLSHPQRRSLYDLSLGYSRGNVIQVPTPSASAADSRPSHAAYLDASDRPLSSGEIFALLMLGLTLVGCFILVVALAVVRGDAIFPETALPRDRLPLELSLIDNAVSTRLSASDFSSSRLKPHAIALL